MKRSTTLRAFLMSCLSVFLCVAMLMGSTFAWFTDSVESAKNVIAAGNLDIELYHADKGTNGANVEVKNDTVLFDDVDSTKWEPGAMAYEVFTVENKGSLALKYQFTLEALNATVVGGHSFAEMLQVAVVTNPNYTYNRDSITTDATLVWKNLETFTLDGNLEAGANTVYGIVIWWKPTADDNIFNMRNENNDETVSVKVGVKLFATQYSSESDSFDNTYDEDAWMDGMQVVSADDLQAAINAGETNIILMDDIVVNEPIVIPATAATYSLRNTTPATVIDLNGKTVSHADGIDAPVIYNYGVLNLKNGVINAVETTAIRNHGSAAQLTLDNITITQTIATSPEWQGSAVFTSGGATTVINSGSYTGISSAAIVATNGGYLTINGGTFTADVTTVRVDTWSQNSFMTINGGTFNVAVEGAKALYADGYKAADGVNINGGIFNGTLDSTYTAININGGIFNKSIKQAGGHQNYYNISGGTFVEDVTAVSKNTAIVNGYSVVKNADGSYTVLAGDVVAGDNASLNDALANGESNIALGEGNFSMPGTNGDVTISGTVDTVITIDKPTANKVTLNGVTVVGSGAYTGIQHSDTVVYENCVIKGVQFLYANNVTFKNCTIDLTDVVDYIWTYTAKNVEFIDCTFNTNGKAILIYAEDANLVTNVTVKGCTFNATASEDKAAIEIDSHYAVNGHYTLTTENNVFDSEHFTGEWRIKNGAKDNTTVNGVVYNRVEDGLYKGTDNTFYVYNANGLKTLNAKMADKSAGRDVVVELMADIDFAGKTWTPVDSHVDFGFYLKEINGNGHTISNLTINGQAMFTRFSCGAGNDVVIKDVTFDNATVNSESLNSAIIVGQTYNNLVLDNVDVKNSTITGGYKVATLIATVYNESSSTITATLKNCDVSDTTVKGNLDFMIAGMVAFVYEDDNDKVVFENCTVTNAALKSNSTGYYSLAAVYCNDGNAAGSFDNVDGVTVNNVTKN